MIKREFYRFLASVSFFTRIPISSKNINLEHYQKSIRYLTWVGLLLSVTSAYIIYGAVQIFPYTVAIIIGLTINTLLTGALHEDGLADVCDAFGGGYSKQQILDIMKDSHIGTYGVIGLILSYLFRFVLLVSIPVHLIIIIFIAGNIVSRFTLTGIMYYSSYTRNIETSKSITVIGKYNIVDLIIAVMPVILVFIIINKLSILLTLIPVIITVLLLVRFFNRKIGGYTGDCLGATQQITEIIFYLATLVWIKYFL